MPRPIKGKTMGKNIVKVGDKGRWVEIPEGWEHVKEGDVKHNDLFWNYYHKRFTSVDEDDLKCEASDFDVLIRKIKN